MAAAVQDFETYVDLYPDTISKPGAIYALLEYYQETYG
jgi:hypothetical protein